MRDLIDAFWRASAYCLHPRVIALSVLPLLVAGGLTLAAGWFFWEAAVDGVRATLEGWLLISAFLQWLDSMGAEGFRAVLAPLVVVALAVPVIVLLSLLMVAVMMTPALVSLVARRRFPTLERKRGAGLLTSVMWSLGYTLLALLVLAASVPLWLIPPLVLVIPPLVWGWLTYRVMAFDVLADHASRGERETLLRQHRWPLLAMGVVSGYLGAAPSLLWAMSAVTLIFAPLLIVVSVWLYTLVFAFSSLWFAHYALAALQRLRVQAGAAPPSAGPVPVPAPAAEPPALPPA
ncbi:EI24 domain-containing protein [Aquincola sp. MAHUQ-54]|uniref:EI24 domain-containing protein n=1 Tax=Aquincola agrisoli TaxID=3119538 RepID=A0AAW9PXS5_9BURK